jgi:hypothetical protein
MGVGKVLQTVLSPPQTPQRAAMLMTPGVSPGGLCGTNEHVTEVLMLQAAYSKHIFFLGRCIQCQNIIHMSITIIMLVHISGARSR